MIDFAGCDFGDAERKAVNRVMEGTWLASGKENEAFEKEFALHMGVKHAIAVNSGSSANLLAMASLDLSKGSEVITSGCGFPATLTPILHCGLKPVLVDYDLTTHNIDLDQVEDMMGNGCITAIILAHTLGNPVDMPRLMKVAKSYGVQVIEDCCEAVGSMYYDDTAAFTFNGRPYKSMGSFGDIGTYSFYPSHQMTALGTGGMVVTSDDDLALKLRSLRDWGKVCDWDSYLGDHKTRYNFDGYFKQYTYETVGYNMKLSESAAAFGRVQLKKLIQWGCVRRYNHLLLTEALSDLQNVFVSVEKLPDAIPSWFGYVLTFKDRSYSRNDFSDYLESKGIRTRPFFAGNITRHKPFKEYEQDFPVADKLMRDSLFVGVWQGITTDQLKYMSDVIHRYFKEKPRKGDK